MGSGDGWGGGSVGEKMETTVLEKNKVRYKVKRKQLKDKISFEIKKGGLENLGYEIIPRSDISNQFTFLKGGPKDTIQSKIS